MTPPVLRFDHPGLTVADLEQSAGFYARAFGFTTSLTFNVGAARGLMLEHPSGMRFELFEVSGSQPGIEGRPPLEAMRTRGFGHVAFAAPAIDAIVSDVLAEGGETVLAPQPSPEPGVRFAFVADPDGHLIELVER